jgi:hypothetical protein
VPADPSCLNLKCQSLGVFVQRQHVRSLRWLRWALNNGLKLFEPEQSDKNLRKIQCNQVVLHQGAILRLALILGQFCLFFHLEIGVCLPQRLQAVFVQRVRVLAFASMHRF